MYLLKISFSQTTPENLTHADEILQVYVRQTQISH